MARETEDDYTEEGLAGGWEGRSARAQIEIEVERRST